MSDGWLVAYGLREVLLVDRVEAHANDFGSGWGSLLAADGIHAVLRRVPHLHGQWRGERVAEVLNRLVEGCVTNLFRVGFFAAAASRSA
jgi:hypothetical protein